MDNGGHEERAPKSTPDDQRDNEIGYRNVDEEAEHDERGAQGRGPEESLRANADARPACGRGAYGALCSS